jgi:DNA repair protein SbcD/Mre11
MKILHTSDWHIGRQFHNVSLLEDQAFVLEQILEIIRDQQVEVVLIAGDIYDRSVPPAGAVSLLDNILTRICSDLKVPVIMIAGNHDGPERLSFGSRQLSGAGLYVTGSLGESFEPVILEDQAGKIAFYSIPYTDPATVSNKYKLELKTHDEAMAFLISQIMEKHDPKLRSVVLSHLFLQGGESSESERPLSLGGLDKVSTGHFKPFNYAALGHLHGPQQAGAEHIRYSGSLLKYSFSEEKHKKSVSIVELDEKGNCSVEQIPLHPRRDMRILEGALDDILDQGKNDPKKEDYLLVRLTDTHAILDIMNKLREVYPNVLHLERPGLMATGEQRQMKRDHLKRDEVDMFRDFFQQISGNELNKEQAGIIENELEKIHSGKED